MIGAIIGDIVGSPYEWNNIKTTNFPLFSSMSVFTDDTVLTIAIADAILNRAPYQIYLKKYYRQYPNAGYGGRFHEWALSSSEEPYNSWGNGSAMRVSPVGWAFESLDEVLAEAENSASVTHNHPEGIKGAQAVSSAIFLARTGSPKKEIESFITERFHYNLEDRLDDIRPHYHFDVSCQGSVPQAIIAFLESRNFEDALRKAVSIGGDSDTIACIAGGIAQAFYREMPKKIEEEAFKRLTPQLQEVVTRFRKNYNC